MEGASKGFTPALSVYMASNLATQDGATRWAKSIIPSENLAETVGKSLFKYSSNTRVRWGLGVAVLATGTAAVYEFFSEVMTAKAGNMVSRLSD